MNGGARLAHSRAAAWGLYKSTDGGTTWTFLHNGAARRAVRHGRRRRPPGSPCSVRGVRRVAIDPSNPSIVYAGLVQRGVWRSTDAGATGPRSIRRSTPADANMRPEFAVNALPAARRACTCTKGSTGQPDLPPVPQRQTSPPARRCSRTCRAATRPTRYARTTSAPASAGTTTSSTRRPGTPTSCTSAARIVRRALLEQARRRALDRRGRQRDRHDDGRDGLRCTRTACIPTSTRS